MAYNAYTPSIPGMPGYYPTVPASYAPAYPAGPGQYQQSIPASTAGQNQMPQMTQNASGIAAPTVSRNGDGSTIWVSGYSGAANYPINRGDIVMMMDTDNAKFYIKSTDPNTGRPVVETYEYYKVANQENQGMSGDYVPKEDFTRLQKEVASMSQAMQQIAASLNNGQQGQPKQNG